MKNITAWECDVCEAIFECDEDTIPDRCSNCLSTHEHLTRVDDKLPEGDLEDEDIF